MIKPRLSAVFSTMRVDDQTFRYIQRTPADSHSVGFTNDAVIKIEHRPHTQKLLSLHQEAEMLSYLNKSNCVSCPRLIDSGTLANGQPYMITQRLRAARKSPTPADYLLSLLEQKQLGVYQGDFKPENMIFSDNICYLIDFDQAQKQKDFAAMNTWQFIEWLEKDFYKRRGHQFFEDPARSFDKDEWRQQFSGKGALQLNKTSLVQHQHTTNTESGIYHSLNTPRLQLPGARSLDARSKVMDRIAFKKSESVLDVGCNTGLLCHYLAKRGAQPTGIDLDQQVISLAKIVANIETVKSNFYVSDLETSTPSGTFDTICVFSVLQHVQRMKQVAKLLAKKARHRIIIEARLQETGCRYADGRWQPAEAWDCSTLDDLYDFLTSLFPGFAFEKNWGVGDRDRHIITLRRE